MHCKACNWRRGSVTRIARLCSGTLSLYHLVTLFLQLDRSRGDGKVAGREEIFRDPLALCGIAKSGTLTVIRRITKAGSPFLGAAGVKSATIPASASHNSTSLPSCSEMRARIKLTRKALSCQCRAGSGVAVESGFRGICPSHLGRLTQRRGIRILPAGDAGYGPDCKSSVRLGGASGPPGFS